MTPIQHEWPNFSGVPDDDLLNLKRPKGQALGRWVWWDGDVREARTVAPATVVRTLEARLAVVLAAAATGHARAGQPLVDVGDAGRQRGLHVAGAVEGYRRQLYVGEETAPNPLDAHAPPPGHIVWAA